MKIYLAGPMRGIAAYNHPAFDRAAAALRNAGHDVFSPAEEDRKRWPDRPWATYTGDPQTDGLSDEEVMDLLITDLQWIAKNANQLVLLPGWQNSKGAAVEVALAKAKGIALLVYIDI